MSQATAVLLEDVGMSFGANQVLQGVSTHIRQGEFVVMLGASGCGKSTLLNLISGLELPTAGAMEIPADGVAYMFQDHALFPWLSVSENVDLALRLGTDLDKAARAVRVQELLDLVRLGQVGDKRPHELSGGMRQRVALARSFAPQRQVLLMDEPFAALDAITRDVIHEELLHIWRQSGSTIIFVTHNVQEAIRLGQRVLLLSSRPGRIIEEWVIDEQSKEPAAAAQLTVEITARLRAEISRHVH